MHASDFVAATLRAASSPQFMPQSAKRPASEIAPANVSPSDQRRTVASWLLIAAIHAYRLTLAPFLGGNCKFYPSCSHYAEQAIKIHGPKRGTLLAAKRLLRCRPFTKGGHDPVPDREEFQSAANGQEHQG
jgi:putative membrane protein insertion efficiency factor